MILVLPISKTDKKLINSFCDILRSLGPYEKHKVLYVYKKSDAKLVNKVKSNFKNIFGSVDDCIIGDECPIGWPTGPNYFWRQAISFLQERKNDLPWYWMELDVTPIKKNWLDLLENEYLYFGKPFMGFVANISNNYPRHLSGCAIYPPNISLYTNEWKWIHRSGMAFDIVCGAKLEVIRNTHFGMSMLNLFRSKNFKIDNDGLVYDRPYSPFEFGLREDLKMQKITKNTLVIHGCKDGSLARIIKENVL